MSSRSTKRADPRLARAKRNFALERPELRREPKPAALTDEAVAAAIAAGKFTRIPPRRKSS
jgi:hypothetical protein